MGHKEVETNSNEESKEDPPTFKQKKKKAG